MNPENDSFQRKTFKYYKGHALKTERILQNLIPMKFFFVKETINSGLTQTILLNLAGTVPVSLPVSNPPQHNRGQESLLVKDSQYFLLGAFPGSVLVKNPPVREGDAASIPGSGSSPRREW